MEISREWEFPEWRFPEWKFPGGDIVKQILGYFQINIIKRSFINSLWGIKTKVVRLKKISISKVVRL